MVVSSMETTLMLLPEAVISHHQPAYWLAMKGLMLLPEAVISHHQPAYWLAMKGLMLLPEAVISHHQPAYWLAMNKIFSELMYLLYVIE